MKPARLNWRERLKVKIARLITQTPSPSTRSKKSQPLEIGLAISSGGAKALAHIGVIQVLEEHHIRIDAMAGSSMGAYISACWGYGYDGRDMEALARELEGKWKWLRLVDPAITPRRGFIKGDRIRDQLATRIANARFEELKRPIAIAATRLDTLKPVFFTSGDVTEAVHASLAVPGVFHPVMIDGVPHVDGGIVDPVPVAALRQLGAKIVIAVKVLPSPGSAPEYGDLACNGNRHGAIAAWLNQHLNYFAYGNIQNTMMRATHAAQIRIAEASCQNADLVLSPVCHDGLWTDFRNPGKYIALGRQAAEEQIDAILDLVETTQSEKVRKRIQHHERKSLAIHC